MSIYGKHKNDGLSERAKRKLDAICRPDGTLDTNKLTFVDNDRTIDEWFADIEKEERNLSNEKP